MDQILSRDICRVSSVEQIKACYSVMAELRPHLSDEEGFVAQVQRQMSEGYQLVYLQEEGVVGAVIGYRYLEFLAWGKVLYIDDLITGMNKQRRGFGTTLLKWVIEEAKNRKCDQVHLDSGSHRHEAHRLYLNHGFKIIGHHFALNFNDPSYILRTLIQ